jgi:hypothetical protein
LYPSRAAAAVAREAVKTKLAHVYNIHVSAAAAAACSQSSDGMDDVKKIDYRRNESYIRTSE